MIHVGLLVDINQNNQSYFADISGEKLLDSLVWIQPMRTKLGLLGWREEGDWQSRNLEESRYGAVLGVSAVRQIIPDFSYIFGSDFRLKSKF